MKLYLVADIKKHMKANNPNIARIEIEKFFNNKNIYNHYVKDVYFEKTTNKTNYVKEEDLEKITLLATMKLKGVFDISGLKFIEKDDNIVHMQCNSYETYIQCLIAHNRSSEIKKILNDVKETKKNKHPANQEYSKNKGNLEIPTENKKFVSIDFEYFSRGLYHNLKACSEIGIAVKDINGTTYEHYIFEDALKEKSRHSKNLQNKFKFGQSKIIKTEDVRAILEDHFKGMDYLVFHDMTAELRIFQNSKIEINLDHVQILDTQEMHLNYERDEFDNKKTLKNALEYHNLPVTHLHNSGNDAAYTLNLLFKMIDSHTLKKEPSIEIESSDKKPRLKM